MEYSFILHLSIILFCTKIFSLISNRLHLPGVVGALLTGIILGPIGLGLLQENESIQLFAEIGVILIMFNAGIETDLENLTSGLKKTLVIVLGDIGIPILAGIFIGLLLKFSLATSIFLGILLASTSMSITVETLNEFKQLKSASGNAILSTAILDDLIGVILLTFVIALTGDTNGGILTTLVNFVLFFTFTYFSGMFANKIIHYIEIKFGKTHRVSLFSLAYCFLLSYVAEFFGIADITGAYFAGLFLSKIKLSHYVESKTEVLSYLLFSPIFFSSIGLKASLPDMNFNFIMVTTFFVIGAVLAKVIGAGLFAYFAKYSKKDALRIGVGMVPRGEVTLIVATTGLTVGLIPSYIFSIAVIIVIFTSLISPILLAKLYD